MITLHWNQMQLSFAGKNNYLFKARQQLYSSKQMAIYSHLSFYSAFRSPTSGNACKSSEKGSESSDRRQSGGGTFGRVKTRFYKLCQSARRDQFFSS